MTIGTSLGGHYQDEHHYQARDFKSDIQRSVDKAVKGITWEDDPDLIRSPIEISPADTSSLDEMGNKEMQIRKSMGEDPGNIYNDSGEMVDYDFKQGDPFNKGDLPPMKPNIVNPEDFNEIDAMIPWGTPDLPRKTDEQIRKESEELNK